MRQVEDPVEDYVFGMLTFVSGGGGINSWDKQEHLELVGGAIRLTVHADGNGPTQDQRQLYLAFKQAGVGLRAELQEALFGFYKVEREVYADICSDIEGYAEDFLPVLESSEQIWGILTPYVWMILGPESGVGQTAKSGEKCDTILFWHGCWDVEHEFGALFNDGKLLGVESHGNF